MFVVPPGKRCVVVSAYDINGYHSTIERWLYGKDCYLSVKALCETKAPSGGGKAGNGQ